MILDKAKISEGSSGVLEISFLNNEVFRCLGKFSGCTHREYMLELAGVAQSAIREFMHILAPRGFFDLFNIHRMLGIF